jgi:hypothetical protein
MQLPGPTFGPAEDTDRRMPIAGRSLGELPAETAVARIDTKSVTRARILAEGTLFGLLAIGLTWPLAAHFTTHATGSNSWDGTTIFFETPVNIWNLWWFRYALIELGQSPFDGSYIFYPHGADLWFHTVAPVPALVGTILQTFLGVVATYNTLVVVSFIAAGVFATAVARELGVTPRSATLAGAIYAFSPVVVGHLYAGHFELLWTFWIPATVLAFLRLIGQPGDRGWTRAAGLGMMVAAAAYTCNYYAVYAVEAMAVTAAVRWRELLQGRVLRRVVLAAVVAIAGVAPMAVRFVSAEGVLGSAADVSADFRDLSIEPLAFFVPSFTHPLFSATLNDLQHELNGGRGLPQEVTGYLGFSVIALVGLAIFGWRRRCDRAGRPPVFGGRLALAIAASFLALSLGSELKVRGNPTGLPLPAALLAHVPIVRLARAPGRHMVVAMLGVAVLAGAGWDRIARRRWRATLVAAVALEYWAGLPLLATAVPAVYHRLAREPGSFAVMDVPVGARDGRRVMGRPNSLELLAQSVHHKPIIGGMASRLSADRWASILGAPLIGALIAPDAENMRIPKEEVTRYFRRYDIRAIVVHQHATAPERQLIETLLPIRRREHFPDGTELWWVE